MEPDRLASNRTGARGRWSRRSRRLVTGGVLAAVMLAAGQPALARSQGWSVVPSPNSSWGAYDVLYGVSCASARACMAVGTVGNDNSGFKALAESWNGAQWTVTPSAGSHGASGILRGVSCVSATACMAVGSYGRNDRTLAESWNGTKWSVAPSPSRLVLSYLTGVSCVSATTCMAVGAASNKYGSETLAESWNGTKWSVVPSPNAGRGRANGTLSSVSCTSATACMAVGAYQNDAPRGMYKTLVEVWNGTRWSVVPSPEARSAARNNWLYGVSCRAASACTAVGARYSKHIANTLIEQWNGGSWSVVPSPNAGGRNYLYGVSCVSARACTAAGAYLHKSQARTLAESWNGTRWRVVASPSPNPKTNGLSGVACESAGNCTAVGSHGDKTLIETS